MIDREKVIQELNDSLKNLHCGFVDCVGDVYAVSEETIKNIIDLLKEQKTTFKKDGHHIRCLRCGEYWCDKDKEGNPFPMNFCPNCGKQVKWE